MHTHDENNSISKRFELPGSRAHYAPSLSFTIDHMRLEIEPDLKGKTISCKQRLSIITLHDTDIIELDAAELQINLVSAAGRLDFRSLDDKLVVKLGRILNEGSKIELDISYAAKPRRGFYFVAPDKYYPAKHLEAWTQGETTEAKYWFPCIDHPRVKFSREISVLVPMGFTAVSEGRSEHICSALPMAMPRRTICEKSLNLKRARACSNSLINGFLGRAILSSRLTFLRIATFSRSKSNSHKQASNLNSRSR